MSETGERPAWDCGCSSDHRTTLARAWCFDCREFCYPTEGGLCIRGEYAKLATEVRALRVETGEQQTEIEQKDGAIVALRAQIEALSRYVAREMEEQRTVGGYPAGPKTSSDLQPPPPGPAPGGRR